MSDNGQTRYIGRIDGAGRVVRIRGQSVHPDILPNAITSGPGRALWVVDRLLTAIARIALVPSRR